MDKSRYADLFRTESREQLAALNRALLALEQGEPMREPVDAIFRGVHTIKGMSATMGYSAVAEFSHELESLLDRVRTGEQGLTAELMDALFAAADALEDGIEGAREDDAMSPDMKRVLERLLQLDRRQVRHRGGAHFFRGAPYDRFPFCRVERGGQWDGARDGGAA